jgi:hypothetical protein
MTSGQPTYGHGGTAEIDWRVMSTAPDHLPFTYGSFTNAGIADPEQNVAITGRYQPKSF